MSVCSMYTLPLESVCNIYILPVLCGFEGNLYIPVHTSFGISVFNFHFLLLHVLGK